MNIEITQPVISLIVPFYRAESFIPRLLNNINDALQNVNKEDVEVIFVDDCGGDSSLDQLKSSKLFEYKIVSEGINQGLGGARNCGVKHASGNWIMFLDHDDLLSSNCFNILLDTIRSNDALNFIRFHFAERFIDKVNEYTISKPECELDYLFPVMAWSKVIRKELYVQSQLKWKYEDSLWTLDFIKSGLYKDLNAEYINDILYTYDRTNEYSITSQIHVEDYKEYMNQLVRLTENANSKILPYLQLNYIYLIKKFIFEDKNFELSLYGLNKILKMKFFRITKIYKLFKGRENNIKIDVKNEK